MPSSAEMKAEQKGGKTPVTIFFFFFQCEPIAGLGFRRGSYKCVCKKGFYFPQTDAYIKYYNGTILEEEYEKKLMVSVCTVHCASLIHRVASSPALSMMNYGDAVGGEART